MSNTLEGFNAGASTLSADVAFAFWLHIWLSLGLFLSVVIPMFYFVWKYRSDKVKDEDIGNVTHHTGLEITWTVIPMIIMMVFFYYGNTTMQMFRTMPAESQSIVVHVEGSKWKWKYEYPANKSGYVHKIGGVYDKEKKTMGISALYVPINTNIILKMTAPLNDVLHSYYIPAFRMKEDVVPGRITKQWFNSSKIGSFDVECAEYCGTDHSYMYSKVVVMEKDAYEAWFNSNKEDTPKGSFAKDGKSLFAQNGCLSCHSIDTEATLVGPSLQIRLNAEQVLDVINNGQEKLGYPMGAMPAGLVSGKDAEEIALYVAGGMKGQQPTSFAACASCHGEDGKGMGGMSPNLVDFDATLLSQVFKHGKEGIIGRMPVYPNMSEEDISIMAEYLEKNK